MRILKLDLIRFGCFTDKTIELPRDERDIHVIFGPNEAGKSTALLAIENLLFGITGNSPYNFLHSYKDMRIGAVLENGAVKLEIRRRKGNKDTLLTPGGAPVRGGEGALAPYLGGADEESFTRIFSLDHRRLRKGGGEVLDSRNDAGHVLLSAGTGLSGIRKKLEDLKTEADSLWGPRRAAHREYYKAYSRLEEAEKAIREHTVTAAKWEELRRAFGEAEKRYHSLDEERKRILSGLGKLQRIRRVYNDVAKLAGIESRIREMSGVIGFPEDALDRFEKAERELDRWSHQAETLKLQLEEAKAELEGMMYDEELLLREDEILLLRDRRAAIQKERADLPNREAELALEESEFRKLAREAGWNETDIEKLIGRLPERPEVAAARELLNRRGETMSAVSSAGKALQEARSELRDITREIADMGEAADASGLEAVVGAVRGQSDISIQIQQAERELKTRASAIDTRLKSLNPAVEEGAILSIPVPPKEAVTRHAEERNALDRRLKECTDKINGAERDIGQLKRNRERLHKEGNAVSPAELSRTREFRDAGWALVKRYYVDGGPVPDSEITAFTGGQTELVDAYEEAVANADRTADRRFDNAKAAAEITTLSRQIAEKEEILEVLRVEERTLSGESLALDSAWKKMWEAAPFEPLQPESMLAWIDSKNEIYRLLEERAEAAQRLGAFRNEESEGRALIFAELSRLGPTMEGIGDKPLRVVIEAASQVLERRRREAVRRRDLESRLAKTMAAAEHREKELRSAEEEKAAWEAKWRKALMAVGLSEDTDAPEAASKLDVIDDMREKAVRINELRHQRIEKIKRDIVNLAEDVRKFAGSVAKDLANGDDAESVIIELERRRAEAEKIKERRKEKEKDITRLERKIKEAGESAEEARETIAYLQKTAGEEDRARLREMIQESDRLRELESEKGNTEDKLLRDGDGLALEDIIRECGEVDIAQVRNHIEELEERLNGLSEEIKEAAGELSLRKGEFEAIGGSDRAAEAAARKESAIAEMERIMERYVRLRSAATMLEWAIERYRKENQDPMINRASRRFQTLTNGSFSGLDTEIDERDRVQIIGLRPGGGKVEVSGMSDGTADQLYLALRIAAVEDYIERSNALPFVADDLFINFDDRRSAAGLRILGELSEKTQVLFFTHHAHLVELARETLGESVNVVRL